MKIRDPQKDHADYLQWERDANMRLYYPLWILFIGGFAFQYQHPPATCGCLAASLVCAFRLLAIAGTVLNFILQNCGIDSVSHANRYLFYEKQIRCKQLDSNLSDEERRDAIEKLQKQLKEENDATVKCDRWAKRLEPALIIVAGLFLIVALVLSFL